MIKGQRIIGIVLSGGKSSRMGSEKGLVKWKGKALIEYSVDCLLQVCDEIVISTNGNFYDYLNLPIVPDVIDNCGPMGGIYSCMKSHKADLYLIISCDVPNVPVLLYHDMIQSIGHHNLIVARDRDGRIHPLIAVYRASCLSNIEKKVKAGQYKMMKLLDSIPHTEFRIDNNCKYYDKTLLSNLNSPSDFKAL